MDDLRGKVAFVTGSASGIGLGIARACAEAGMKVALADLDEADLDRTAADLRQAGAEAIAVPLDVTDRLAWTAAVEQVHAQAGLVQLVVNNAGVSTFGMRFDEIEAGLWDRMVAINLTGVYNGVHFLLDDLRNAGDGHIVNTASMAGIAGGPLLAPYCATKFGVVGLSEAIRSELADWGIGVTTLCPSNVRTNIWRSSLRLRGLPDSETPPDEESMTTAAAATEPYEVGRRVLEAVLANEPYVFTEPGHRAVAEEHQARLLHGFDRAVAFKP